MSGGDINAVFRLFFTENNKSNCLAAVIEIYFISCFIRFIAVERRKAFCFCHFNRSFYRFALGFGIV